MNFELNEADIKKAVIEYIATHTSVNVAPHEVKIYINGEEIRYKKLNLEIKISKLL